MRTLLLALAASSALLAPAIAHADQCAWVSKTEAINGAKDLGQHFGAKYLEYCEPCGDTKPTPVTVKGVSFSWADDSHQYFQVKVNGKMVDLAYAYTAVDENGDGKADYWQNVGEAAGCPVQDVSSTLDAATVSQSGAKFDEADEDFTDDSSDGGGCSTTGGSSSLLFGLGAAGLAIASRRRRR
jgi:MYXO-CTERM domain-containing protein